MSDPIRQATNIASGVQLPGVVTPQAQMFLDVIPPNFPNGVSVIFMRPGELQAAGSIDLPLGAMLVYVPPEQASQMRGMMKQANDAQRSAAERQARNGVGHRG